MNAERQVTVRGTPAAIEAWIQTLSDPITEGWSRGKDIERKVKGKRDVQWPICLIWTGQGHHPKTAIFLKPVSDSEIGVTSIVPLDRKELAPEDRGAALKAFQIALITPSAEELELADQPAAAPSLSEEISPRALARFVTFARTANKTVIHSGLDLPRWYDFLIQLHREGSQPPREILATALKDAAFSEEVIRQMLDVFDNTDDLLTRYDALGGE
jgi:hypothetical protein